MDALSKEIYFVNDKKIYFSSLFRIFKIVP